MTDRPNALGWSSSRANSLRTCPRQYYYRYYGSRGGWAKEADASTRRTFMLSRLRTRHMWAGELVHQTIQQALIRLKHSGSLGDTKQLLLATRERMRREFSDSRAHRYRSDPESLGLFEHEYKLDLASDDWLAIAEHVDECLRSFLQCDTLKQLMNLPETDWLDLEELRSFELDGARIGLKLDLAFRDAGKIVVVDWKTGRHRSSTQNVQFGTYALYAEGRWKLPPEAIEIREVNLALGQTSSHHFNQTELTEIQAEITKSLALMSDLLRDDTNQLALEEDFPKREGQRVCSQCAFLAICDTSFELTDSGVPA
jgi:hypothetical protein